MDDTQRLVNKEGLFLIPPSHNDEMIHNIEVGLNFKLLDWQKAYILGLIDYKMPGRRTGKTTAHILKILLSEGEPIKIYERDFSDENHGIHYRRWFEGEMKELYRKLSNPSLNLKLRKVYFSPHEKSLDEARRIEESYNNKMEHFIYKGENNK